MRGDSITSLYNDDIKDVVTVNSSIYPTRRNPKVMITAISLVVIITLATYGVLVWQAPTRVLTVYTYDSFMYWGNDTSTIDDRVFGPFEQQYGVDVKVVRLDTDANGVVSKLVAESANPVADVVIGIDNILVLQSAARSVLTPYTPANLELVNSSVVNALGPDHYVTPFDFGLVTLVYRNSQLNTTSNPELSNLTFSNLADMASMLVTENPHLSSPGLAFLLSEIAVYEKLLGKDWTEWWQLVKSKINVQEGWSEAWNVWDTDPARKLLVSYGTDPAYDASYSGAAPDTAVGPILYNGMQYAWMQVEGMGLVKNGPNPSLGQALIDYCLTPSVQDYVALNQWMFPANANATLDPVFNYALHPQDVVLLNSLLSAAEISANLTSWLDQYDEIMIGS
jgi:thiamine transport system substrate-binding protein